MTRASLRALIALAVASCALAPPAMPQRSSAQSSQLQVVRSTRVPQVSLDSLPALPAYAASSPRTSLLFADRTPVEPAAASLPASSGLLVDYTIPAAYTGTTRQEVIQYQLPSAPIEPSYPLVVTYHGFGTSAASVAAQTGLDEACDANGWAYLAVTGIDDKLFGTSLVQENVEAAIEWMLANSDVDPDRIYMVGFSMGAGIVTNFAARHRDPQGVMIAAVATVAGSFDWTMGWTLDPSIQAWMLNPWNFGTDPFSDPFAYQRASAVWHDPGSYPPLPGLHVAESTMATNLTDTPLFVTWDALDTVTYLPGQSLELVTAVTSLGGEVAVREVSGTVDPSTGLAATHSWAVMNLAEVMAFFDGRVVQRLPQQIELLAEEDRTASWLRVDQQQPDGFSTATAHADGFGISTWSVTNVNELTVDLGAAGLDGSAPVPILAASDDLDGYTLRLTGLAEPPSYATSPLDDMPLPDIEWDGESGSLLIPVPPWGHVEALVHFAGWGASLAVTPDPVARNEDFTLTAEARPGSTAIWLLLGLDATPLLLAGQTFYMTPLPPTVLLPVPLDTEGNVSFTVTMPDIPELAGARILFQGAVLGSGVGLTDLTNPVGLDIL